MPSKRSWESDVGEYNYPSHKRTRIEYFPASCILLTLPINKVFFEFPSNGLGERRERSRLV